MRKRASFAVISLLLLTAGSLNAAGTSQWSEGLADFPAGTALNTTAGTGDVRLDRNLAHPANWTGMRRDTSLAPFNLEGYAMAYDDASDISVIFGDGTWTYNVSTNKWKQMGTGGPTGRNYVAMAFDSGSGLMMLFGGWSKNDVYGDFYDETWVYEAKTNQWTQRFPAIAPPPRCGHTMSFDSANGVIVLFGGEAYNESQSATVLLNDTWIYNVSTDTWTDRSPAPSPPAMWRHATAFDRASREVVIFGGYDSTVGHVVGDTWTYNVTANTWTNRTPSTSPEARSEHAMSYDDASGMVVVFGGYAGNSPRRFLADTWTYDSTMGAWTNRTPPHSPFPQCGHVMVYDSAGGVNVLFSGRNERGNVSETWSYSAGPNSWTNLISQSGPSPRSNHAMAYDSANGKVFLFGGQFAWGCVNDIWSYEAGSNAWTSPCASSQAPSARAGHAMVYDSRNGLLVLFGGSGLNDTWAYNCSTSTWANMNPPSAPPPRSEHAMIYDSAKGVVMLFGGVRVQYSPYQIEYLDDTWIYDVLANRWTQKTVLPAPSARSNHAMAYDPAHGVAVLFGGYYGNNPRRILADTWIYDSSKGSWSNVTPQSSPRPGYDYAMAYGGPSSDVLLFGGWDGSAMSGGGSTICNPYPNETWTYRPSTGTWTNRSHTSAPSPRFSAGMACDIGGNQVVLFGGYSSQSALGDTWLYGSWAYFAEGTYTSRPLDAGGSAYFGALGWNATVPAKSSVLFQTRAADTQENLSLRAFVGPDGKPGTYHTASGQRISCALNGSRWVQYRACLKTGNLSETPGLEGVTVDYNLLQSVALLSPAGGETWTGARLINWTASDGDNDSLGFDILLLQDNGSVPLASGLSNLTRSWEWNTSAVPNGTYRIRVAARDDNAAIPLTANATSPEFTVHHPGPPNHAPSVTLLAPANNSIVNETTVRFRWTGEDLDGDRLTYNLTCWAEAPGRPVRASAMTYGTFFNATIPDDNITCYWNVTAFDGRDRSPPSPVRRFDINRTVPNHPPIITSTAPANATAGEQYEYLLTAEDADGDRLAYALPSRPEGMRLGGILPNATGIRILWTPAKTQRGSHNATVEVTDGRGGRAEQTFLIRVEVLNPKCAIAYPAGGATVKGVLRVNGTATRGSAEVARVEVRIDGGKWKDANGTLSWDIVIDTTKLGNGDHAIEARATDGELQSETVAVRVTVSNPAPKPEPVGVTVEGLPWAIVAIVVCVAGLMGFMMLRRRRRD